MTHAFEPWFVLQHPENENIHEITTDPESYGLGFVTVWSTGKEHVNLIAAAPDLLEVLKTAKLMLERDYIDPQKMAVIDKCEAAIAKAMGEQP